MLLCNKTPLSFCIYYRGFNCTMVHFRIEDNLISFTMFFLYLASAFSSFSWLIFYLAKNLKFENVFTIISSFYNENCRLSGTVYRE